jgi:hypothetical protein
MRLIQNMWGQEKLAQLSLGCGKCNSVIGQKLNGVRPL